MVDINIRQSEVGYSNKIYVPDLVWNNEFGDADLVIKDHDLQSENLIYTAILMQLFTNIRADESDGIQAKDPQGWLGNAIEDDDENFVIGSHLWTLDKSLINTQYSEQAERYVGLAMDKFIEQNLILKYNATVRLDKMNKKSIIVIELTKNDGSDLKFEYAWSQIYGV